ncbi:MAG: nucleotidyltransferase family protein [Armatimonadota bacterium]
MTRSEVIRLLTEHREELRALGVRSLALFGSAARDEAHDASDVDLLVKFERAPGFDGYMKLKFRLEGILGRRVDLVMEDALKPWARPTVEREAVHVA